MKELYCITCPAGCLMTLSDYGNPDYMEVEGNGCENGIEFARAEVTNPTRTLTTTVKTTIPGVPVLPVRTDGEIPKEQLLEAMKVLSNVVVNSELNCNDTVLDDIVGSGIRVIASSDMLMPSRRGAEISESGSSDFQDILATGTFESTAQTDDYYEYNPEDEPNADEAELEAAEPENEQQNQGRSHISR